MDPGEEFSEWELLLENNAVQPAPNLTGDNPNQHVLASD